MFHLIGTIVVVLASVLFGSGALLFFVTTFAPILLFAGLVLLIVAGCILAPESARHAHADEA